LFTATSQRVKNSECNRKQGNKVKAEWECERKGKERKWMGAIRSRRREKKAMNNGEDGVWPVRGTINKRVRQLFC
jgi:hypothetical protein